MSDAGTISSVALAALAVGAGALRLGQIALKRNGHRPTAGQLSAEWWEQKMAEINVKALDEKVLPILERLEQVAQKQNEIQQKQNEILIELVTASRIGRRQ